MQYYTATTRLPYHIPYPWYLLGMSISDTARVLYSLILHRINLSRCNGWVDDEGRVLCIYTIESLMHDTHKSKSTIKAALSELDTHGLIDRQRRGHGVPNLLYIRVPDIQLPQSQDIGHHEARMSAPTESGYRPSQGQDIAPHWANKPAPNNRKNNNYPENISEEIYLGDGF